MLGQKSNINHLLGDSFVLGTLSEIIVVCANLDEDNAWENLPKASWDPDTLFYNALIYGITFYAFGNSKSFADNCLVVSVCQSEKLYRA